LSHSGYGSLVRSSLLAHGICPAKRWADIGTGPPRPRYISRIPQGEP
jgi:hypothetical protein